MNSKIKRGLQNLKKFALSTFLCSAVVVGGAFGFSACGQKGDNGGGGGGDIVIDEISYTSQEKQNLVSGVKSFLKAEETAGQDDAIASVVQKAKLAVAEKAPEIFKKYKISKTSLAVVAQYLKDAKVEKGSLLDSFTFGKDGEGNYDGTFTLDVVDFLDSLIEYIHFPQDVVKTLSKELGKSNFTNIITDMVGEALITISQNNVATSENILKAFDAVDRINWETKYYNHNVHEGHPEEWEWGTFFEQGGFYDEDDNYIEYDSLYNDILNMLTAMSEKYTMPLTIVDNVVYVGNNDGLSYSTGEGESTQQSPYAFEYDVVYRGVYSNMMMGNSYSTTYYLVFSDNGDGSVNYFLYQVSGNSDEILSVSDVKSNGNQRTITPNNSMVSPDNSYIMTSLNDGVMSTFTKNGSNLTYSGMYTMMNAISLTKLENAESEPIEAYYNHVYCYNNEENGTYNYVALLAPTLETMNLPEMYTYSTTQAGLNFYQIKMNGVYSPYVAIETDENENEYYLDPLTGNKYYPNGGGLFLGDNLYTKSLNYYYMTFDSSEEEVYVYISLGGEDSRITDVASLKEIGERFVYNISESQDKKYVNFYDISLKNDGPDTLVVSSNSSYLPSSLNFVTDAEIETGYQFTEADYRTIQSSINLMKNNIQNIVYNCYREFDGYFDPDADYALISTGSEEIWLSRVATTSGSDYYYGPLYYLIQDWNNQLPWRVDYEEGDRKDIIIVGAAGGEYSESSYAIARALRSNLLNGFTFDGEDYESFIQIIDRRTEELRADMIAKYKAEAYLDKLALVLPFEKVANILAGLYQTNTFGARTMIKQIVEKIGGTIGDANLMFDKSIVSKFSSGELINDTYTSEDYALLLRDWADEIEAQLEEDDSDEEDVPSSNGEFVQMLIDELENLKTSIQLIARVMGDTSTTSNIENTIIGLETYINTLFGTTENESDEEPVEPAEEEPAEEQTSFYRTLVRALRNLAESPKAVESMLKSLTYIAQDMKELGEAIKAKEDISDIELRVSEQLLADKGGYVYHLIEILSALPEEGVRELFNPENFESIFSHLDPNNSDSETKFMRSALKMLYEYFDTVSEIAKDIAPKIDEESSLKDIVLTILNSTKQIEVNGNSKTMCDYLEYFVFDSGKEQDYIDENTVVFEDLTITRPSSLEGDERDEQLDNLARALADYLKNNYLQMAKDRYIEYAPEVARYMFALSSLDSIKHFGHISDMLNSNVLKTIADQNIDLSASDVMFKFVFDSFKAGEISFYETDEDGNVTGGIIPFVKDMANTALLLKTNPSEFISKMIEIIAGSNNKEEEPEPPQEQRIYYIEDESDLEYAIDVLNNSHETTYWYITTHFRITRQHRIKGSEIDLYIQGMKWQDNDKYNDGGYYYSESRTITAEQDKISLQNYALIFEHDSDYYMNIYIENINLVIGDGFRSGIFIRRSDSDCGRPGLYISDSSITMNRSETPYDEKGNAKAGAAIVNNDSDVHISDSTITIDEYCWAAIDLTDERGDAYLHLGYSGKNDDGNVTFNCDEKGDMFEAIIKVDYQHNYDISVYGWNENGLVRTDYGYDFEGEDFPNVRSDVIYSLVSFSSGDIEQITYYHFDTDGWVYIKENGYHSNPDSAYSFENIYSVSDFENLNWDGWSQEYTTTMTTIDGYDVREIRFLEDDYNGEDVFYLFGENDLRGKYESDGNDDEWYALIPSTFSGSSTLDTDAIYYYQNTETGKYHGANFGEDGKIHWISAKDSIDELIVDGSSGEYYSLATIAGTTVILGGGGNWPYGYIQGDNFIARLYRTSQGDRVWTKLENSQEEGIRSFSDLQDANNSLGWYGYATWDIRENITAREQIKITVPTKNLTIDGHNNTITAEQYDYNLQNYVFDFKCDNWNDQTITIRNLTIVVRDGFRSGIVVKNGANVTLENVTIIIEHDSQPYDSNKGEYKNCAAVVVNDSTLNLYGDCAFTIDEYSWAAIDLDNSNGDTSLNFNKEANVTFTCNNKGSMYEALVKVNDYKNYNMSVNGTSNQNLVSTEYGYDIETYTVTLIVESSYYEDMNSLGDFDYKGSYDKDYYYYEFTTTSGTSVTLPSNSNSGHWSFEQEGYRDYGFGDIVTVTSDMTLYFVYNEYEGYYDINLNDAYGYTNNFYDNWNSDHGYQFSGSDGEYNWPWADAGTTIILPTPSANGYDFLYWELNYNNAHYNGGDTFTLGYRDATFTAVWESNGSAQETNYIQYNKIYRNYNGKDTYSYIVFVEGDKEVGYYQLENQSSGDLTAGDVTKDGKYNSATLVFHDDYTEVNEYWYVYANYLDTSKTGFRHDLQGGESGELTLASILSQNSNYADNYYYISGSGYAVSIFTDGNWYYWNGTATEVPPQSNENRITVTDITITLDSDKNGDYWYITGSIGKQIYAKVYVDGSGSSIEIWDSTYYRYK